MKKIIVLLFVIFVIIFGGFWLYTKNISKVSTYSGPVEKVSLSLKWIHQAQFAGNYVAYEKGYYRDLGLDVAFIPFSYEETSIQSVLTGKSEFGIAGADEVMLARTEGKPVKAIAVIYKTNPVVAFALKSSGINKPQDFIGKTVGIQKGVNTEYLYYAMMKNLGIDRNKIKEVPIGYEAKELLDGTVDISTGYVMNEPQLVKEKGVEINTFLVADYGINMYADVLFTSDKMIEEKPEVVQRFVEASLHGWQEAIEHEDEAVDITMKYAKESDKNHQKYMLSSSIPLINTGKTRLGVMEPTEWTQMQELLIKQNILNKKIDISTAYTTKFVNAIYE